MTATREYSVADLGPYIDWSYLLHAWQMSPRFVTASSLHQCEACRQAWLASYDQQYRQAASEALRLIDDARDMLARLGTQHIATARVALLQANASGDDIIVTTEDGNGNPTRQVTLPCLRQQVTEPGKPCLCLADFVRPVEQGQADRIGIFATTVGLDPDSMYADDTYQRMLAQTLCDRLAEAAACVLHREVRRSLWGYAPDEELTIADMLHERNQGIRPAVGYPSLPDQSLNFILAPLIDMGQMGITLTENGAMRPHATVTGLMISHPQATYFAVGKIDDTQLSDYAARRGLPTARMRQFLAANLG